MNAAGILFACGVLSAILLILGVARFEYKRLGNGGGLLWTSITAAVVGIVVAVWSLLTWNPFVMGVAVINVAVILGTWGMMIMRCLESMVGDFVKTVRTVRIIGTSVDVLVIGVTLWVTVASGMALAGHGTGMILPVWCLLSVAGAVDSTVSAVKAAAKTWPSRPRFGQKSASVDW